MSAGSSVSGLLSAGAARYENQPTGSPSLRIRPRITRVIQMETLIKDLRYGLRGLIKRKSFAAIAVVTLALGIGANTAIFTLVNAVMLKSLPVRQPEELVLFSDATGEGTSVEDTPKTGV